MKSAISYIARLFCILALSGYSYAGNYSPKRIIFVVHNETVYGKGFYQIYKALKARGHHLQIIAIPFLDEDNTVKVDIDHAFLKNFDPGEIIYPCGQRAPYKTCQVPDLKPADYVIVGNPYNVKTTTALHPYYTLSGLKKLGGRIAYFVYGPHIFHAKGNSNSDTLRELIDIAFVDSESTKKIFMHEMGMPEDRVVVAGYQNYKNIRDKQKDDHQATGAYKETILWLPRWSISTTQRDIFEPGSTFMNYNYFFTNYAADHPDTRVIIRPHVYLFRYGVDDMFFSKQDADQIIHRWQSLPNVIYSKQEERSLEDDVLAADIVISDGTSALGEVLVAGKPVIYLSNGWDNEFNSNDLSRQLKHFVYLAHNPFEILEYIKLIRRESYKSQSSPEREVFMKNLNPVENPAEFVADYISSH